MGRLTAVLTALAAPSLVHGSSNAADISLSVPESTLQEADLVLDDECAGDDSSEECAFVALQLRGASASAAAAVTLDQSDVAAAEAFLREEHWRAWQAAHEDPTAAAQYSECKMSSNNTCDLKSLDGKPTLVYPGGETTCIDSGEYAFAVNPGDTDKLVIFFEGGGACWEAKGNIVLQCTDTLPKAIATSGLGAGIQNRKNEKNPFRSYTIVEPLYCSGDAHMGNAIRDWNGQKMPQKGYLNAQAAVDWVKANFPNKLQNLVVSGFSAGALGTVGWVNHLFDTIPAESQVMLVDSYAGVFPPHTEPPILKDWGTCTAPIFAEQQQQQCLEGRFTIKEAAEVALENHPEATFAYIQSKVDGSQIWFYKGVAMSYFAMNEAIIDENQFYRKSLHLMMDLAEYANFKLFLVSGNQHCFTDSDVFFTSTSAGVNDTSGVPIDKWVAKVINHEPAQSVCYGVFASATGGGSDGADFDFCDIRLAARLKDDEAKEEEEE